MLTTQEAMLVVRRHLNAMIDELIDTADGIDANPRRTRQDEVRDDALDGPVDRGEWREVDRQAGISYRWMDGNIDEYTDFVVYEDSASGDTMGVAKIAPREIKGKKRSYQVVFSMDGTKLDPLAVFNEADDFDSTHELLALIRGKGVSKRAFYAPGDRLPTAYEDFKIDTFSDRVSGPRSYTRLAVVATEEDHQTMLDFARTQNKLRFGA